jgi:hypothetical protein
VRFWVLFFEFLSVSGLILMGFFFFFFFLSDFDSDSFFRIIKNFDFLPVLFRVNFGDAVLDRDRNTLKTDSLAFDSDVGFGGDCIGVSGNFFRSLDDFLRFGGVRAL